MERLAESTHLLYSELLEALMLAAYSKRGVSFHTKTVGRKKHWYLEYVVGSEKKAYYLGPDSAELAQQVDAAKRRWRQDAPDANRRARLVSMLVAGGATTLPGSHARILEALEQAGVFMVGGVVVGSHAFALMANMLGVKWPRPTMRTHDIDIAGDTISVTVPPSDLDLQATLAQANKAFFAVPSLNRSHPSTSFQIRGQDLSVSLLTPMRGKPNSSPRRIPALNAMAEPLRFLDYLLDDVQPAAIPVRQGVLAMVPAPARFALHKLVVAQRRPAAFAEKARKDLAQAAAVLEVLFEDRPGDIALAAEAAEQMPKQFRTQLRRSASALPEPSRAQLSAFLRR